MKFAHRNHAPVSPGHGIRILTALAILLIVGGLLLLRLGDATTNPETPAPQAPEPAQPGAPAQTSAPLPDPTPPAVEEMLAIEGFPFMVHHPENTEAHESSIVSLAISPCGRFLASIDAGFNLKLWSTQTMGQLNEWPAGAAWHILRLSPGARYAAMTGASRAAGFRKPADPLPFTDVVDPQDGHILRIIEHPCRDIQFSPGGQHLALLCPGQIEIYDTGSWDETRVIPVGDSGPAILYFPPQDAPGPAITLLSATERLTFSLDTGACIHRATLPPLGVPIVVAAYAPCEPNLALSLTDAGISLRRFSLESAEQVSFTSSPGSFTNGPAAFSADGQRLVQVGEYNWITIMTVPSSSLQKARDGENEDCRRKSRREAAGNAGIFKGSQRRIAPARPFEARARVLQGAASFQVERSIPIRIEQFVITPDNAHIIACSGPYLFRTPLQGPPAVQYFR